MLFKITENEFYFELVFETEKYTLKTQRAITIDSDLIKVITPILYLG